jgi:hypothetical protein
VDGLTVAEATLMCKLTDNDVPTAAAPTPEVERQLA